MRIIDSEDPDTLIHPEQDNALQLIPQVGPLRGLKLERVNILILLGRILGVLNGSIRAPAEPIRVLANVRMLRRGLKRQVNGNFETKLVRAIDQASKILHRT